MRPKLLTTALAIALLLGAGLTWNRIAAANASAGPADDPAGALVRAQLEQELVLAERTAVMLGELRAAEAARESEVEGGKR